MKHSRQVVGKIIMFFRVDISSSEKYFYDPFAIIPEKIRQLFFADIF